MLKNYTAKSQNDWDEQLPFVMMAYRSSVQSSTGYSPNQMMFGRDVRLPVDLVLGVPPEVYETSVEYVQKLQKHIESVHKMARENLNISSSNQKKQYDHRSKEVGFEKDNLVWYYCPLPKKGLSPKFQNSWQGPYMVKRRISDILYEIKRLSAGNTKTLVVHCDKLRSYTKPEEGRSEEDNVIESTQTSSGRSSKHPQWYGINH